MCSGEGPGPSLTHGTGASMSSVAISRIVVAGLNPPLHVDFTYGLKGDRQALQKGYAKFFVRAQELQNRSFLRSVDGNSPAATPRRLRL